MSAPPYRAIANHALVLNAFGRWPSFHDGEVHRVVLDRMRKDQNGTFYSSVELLVRGWNMTSEVTPDGYYKCTNDSIVHFLFEEVYALELDGLNHQNVLSSLDFELIEGPSPPEQFIAVELSHCFGLSGRFEARLATVVSVSPYERQE
jgi:hypothetical protein